MERVVDLHLTDNATRKKWQSFLEQLDLHNFSEREVESIDHTIGLIDEDGKLVATGSTSGNVLKYLGVCNKDAVQGQRFNQIVTALQQYLFSEKIFHFFVFTKKKYSQSFQHLNFRELAATDQAAFLESGMPGIDDYLESLPQDPSQKDKRIAAVVMNANPFTLGHRYLVETASKENDIVYVFVVKTDASLFSAHERIRLVKDGLSDLDNVCVVSSQDYQVSKATFPAYFLKSPDDLIKEQTAIDALVFKNWLAPKLNITSRYLGQEPFSKTTERYNESLIKILEPKIKVKVLNRLTEDDKIITATEVRKLIKNNDLAGIEELVPATTFNFIKVHLTELQTRIKKGKQINGN
ncbi:[citrate (pro-3S)-lyase] ligase [Lactobacillus colini]|uniref:[Citrate [pro-3S]-lyase] ligase n=1 Tax=Lactobacillus colini TaxID=1819254 RepID=A0ABS4MDB6_9LACO|nr:[citrate (pro-3S)-lyase] ligase [Lactobacillus colini]MBP2057680.1 [citrate (pro-3S)-lyase] ligase [Lactobacillus colini]